MPDVRAVVTLPMDSGLPEDAAQNVWHFWATSASDAIAAQIAAALKTFYDTVDTYLSTLINPVNASVEFYDLSDPEPRVPYHQVNIGADMITSTTALPEEVALCLSFQAAAQSGEVQARRRGRIYLGPLGQNALGATSAGNRPLAAFVTALVNAGDALLTASQAATDWDWRVYSRVLQQGFNVDNGWVDNAFDTQRRRGVQATSRTTFS